MHKKILFTRQISDKHIAYGKKFNLSIEDIPLIKVIPKKISPSDIKNIHNNNWKNWVFTSKNAVIILISFFGNSFKNNIYCVGNQTKKLLKDSKYKKIFAAVSAEKLTTVMDNNNINNVLYFCGNLRQDIIPDFFNSKSINYKEIVLYKTKLIELKIDTRKYNGICFCSPSAVKSFFLKNSIPGIPIFSIGKTTAKSIEKYTKDYYIADNASIKSMINKVASTLKI